MASRGILPSLADAAWRLLGRPTPQAVVLREPMAARVDAMPAVDGASPSSSVRTDCGPGGCAPAPGWGLDYYGPLGWAYVGLNRDTIDYACTEQLMFTIVSALVDDACQDTPTLAGEHCGELTDCVQWLAERGYYEAQSQALYYSRQYGGGGVVCFIDDGRPPEMEVDMSAVRDVRGFYALPKWYLVPADAGSDRIGAGWYGQRIGRPEHYWMTPLVPPNLASMGTPNERDEAYLKAGGQRYHRSRVIPWPYRTDMDLRQARRFPNWSGWGPGVVEGCIAAYMARRTGVLRTDTIMASSHFNVFKTTNVANALSTPDNGAGIRNIIAWVQDCLAQTIGGVLPFVTIDPQSTLEAMSHTLTGLSDILREQRGFMLDNLPEYIEPRIFGAGGQAGLSGDSGMTGLWRTYYGNVANYQRSIIWTAGKFGGGQRQAVRLAMLAQHGPTGGQLDMTCKPTWPNLWQEGGEVTARTRKMNAEARALDRTTLGLTPAAMLRHDKTLAGSATSTYASLDVDDGPLPELASQGAPGNAAPNAVDPAQAPTGATTPASAVQAIAAEDEPKADDVGGVAMGPDFEAPVPTATPSAPPLGLPADIATEVTLAKALGMSRSTFRKWAQARGVKVYPVEKGTRGGHRYSGGEVLRAFQESAKARIDAARDANLDARLEDPQFRLPT